MKTIFNTSIEYSPLTFELKHCEKGQLPEYCYDAVDCLGTLVITREGLFRVVQVVDDNTVVLAIDLDLDPNFEPKLLMKWDALMRQEFSQATEQLEFVTDVRPHRHLCLVR
jgi:hypothetical protein